MPASPASAFDFRNSANANVKIVNTPKSKSGVSVVRKMRAEWGGKSSIAKASARREVEALPAYLALNQKLSARK
jgi:hypothetical protein